MTQEEIKLTIELIPAQSWFDNVRSFLKKGEWDEIKKACYANAGHRCEVCGGRGRKHPVECHEIWRYDEVGKVQVLEGLIALCPSCHRVKHLGNTSRLGQRALFSAITHLKNVNGWNDEVAEAYIRFSFMQWHERSRHKWSVDLTWLHSNRESYVRETLADAREARGKRVLEAMKAKSLRSASLDAPSS